MRLWLVLGLLFFLAPSQALAQSAKEPVETVRAFYAKNSIRAYEFYSKRLKGLFVRDDNEARKRGDGQGGIDFAFHVNGAGHRGRLGGDPALRADQPRGQER